MERLLKIKTITDVITNSSTEVFQRYCDEDFNIIKELFNSILKLAKSDLTFDDLYKIEYDIQTDDLVDDYEYYLISINQGEKALEYKNADWRTQYDILNKETYEVLLELAKKHDERNGDEGYPSIRGYQISLKDNISIEDKELAKDIAEQLSKLDNLFESYTAYC